MKRNAIIETRTKSQEELRKNILDKMTEIKKLTLEQAMSKLKNVSLVRSLRRDIAQILTALKNKEQEKV